MRVACSITTLLAQKRCPKGRDSAARGEAQARCDTCPEEEPAQVLFGAMGTGIAMGLGGGWQDRRTRVVRQDEVAIQDRTRIGGFPALAIPGRQPYSTGEGNDAVVILSMF